MGWIIWSQWPADAVAATQAPPAQALPVPEVPPVDEARAVELRAAAENAPEDVQVRVDLGNLYFDAQSLRGRGPLV